MQVTHLWPIGTVSDRLLLFLGGLWILLVLAGTLILAREEFTPVAASPVEKAFPADSVITLASDKPTLLIFVHPLCPCTRATLQEVEALLDATPNKVAVTMVFSVAEGLPSDWKEGDLWKSATNFSGIRVVSDLQGREARRFGVNGSGHCLLYSSSGRLLFSGGVTASRGHVGENPGWLALFDLITSGHAPITKTPVFGCSLM